MLRTWDDVADLGHNRPGTGRPWTQHTWNTTDLGHSSPGTPNTWYTTDLSHRSPETKLTWNITDKNRTHLVYNTPGIHNRPDE